MSIEDQYAVLDGPHIEGFVPGRGQLSVPLVSHIEGNLYQGGCRDGVRLPDDFAFVLSLYPWERYELGPDTKRVEVRLYDSHDVPDVRQLIGAAALVLANLERGKVLVHCQAGLNRAGLINAIVLMTLGRSAEDAIALLREKRDPWVLCNQAFVDWLLNVDLEQERAAA